MKLYSLDSRIKKPLMYAQKYIDSQDFIKDVMSIEKFEAANISPKDILDLFAQFDKRVQIVCSSFGMFHKRVLGRTVGDGKAYVNSMRLDRQIWEVAATIVHESSHVVDEFFPKASFGHGDNSSVGKGQTFPYFIGDRAEIWIKKEVLKDEVIKLALQSEQLREGIAA